MSRRPRRSGASGDSNWTDTLWATAASTERSRSSTRAPPDAGRVLASRRQRWTRPRRFCGSWFARPRRSYRNATDTQTAIAEQIIGRGAHYILRLKESRGTMVENVRRGRRPPKGPSRQRAVQKDAQGHAQILEYRLARRSDWAGLRTAGFERTTIGKVRQLALLPDEPAADSDMFATAAKGHWRIEAMDNVFGLTTCRGCQSHGGKDPARKPRRHPQVHLLDRPACGRWLQGIHAIPGVLPQPGSDAGAGNDGQGILIFQGRSSVRNPHLEPVFAAGMPALQQERRSGSSVTRRRIARCSRDAISRRYDISMPLDRRSCSPYSQRHMAYRLLPAQ